MAEHTPGPWKYSDAIEWRTYGMTIIVTNDDKYPSAFIPAWTDNSGTAAEAEANARLIAAAPELLEAAKKLDDFAWSAITADCTEASEYLMSLITGLRAAVAKAEGRSNA